MFKLMPLDWAIKWSKVVLLLTTFLLFIKKKTESKDNTL